MDYDSQLKVVLDRLDQGLPIDWSDIRIYVVVIIASLIGSLFATYVNRFFGKRGEIDAIKKDLDEITSTQEEIKSKISTEAFVTQKWWDLKQEAYWDLTKALNQLNDAVFEVVTNCFDSKHVAIKNPDVYQPYVNALVKSIDHYLTLSGVSHIVICVEAQGVLKNLAQQIGVKKDDIVGKTYQYDDLENMRREVGLAYDQIISIAREDLNAKIT